MQIFNIAAIVLTAAVADDVLSDEATSLLSIRKANVNRSHITGNSFYDRVSTNTKCKFRHQDRLFKNYKRTLEQCYQDCFNNQDCSFFSHASSGKYKGNCMGCKGDTYSEYVDETERFDAHKTFNLYEIGAKQNQLNENTISLRDWGTQKDRVLTMWHGCVAAANKNWDSSWSKPEMTLTAPLCFKQLKMKYVSGHVSCRSAESGRSFFGCDADSLGLHLIDSGSGAFVFPRDDSDKAWNEANIDGFSSMNKNHAPWYKLSSYQPGSDQLFMKKQGVEYEIPTGDYRLVYNEAHTGGTEGDNSGVACYHVSFFLCDGEDESQFKNNDAVVYYEVGASQPSKTNNLLQTDDSTPADAR